MRLPGALPIILATCSVSLSAQTYIGRLGAGGTLPSDGARASGTVVVGVALSDGLVLAADSRLTMRYKDVPGYKIVSDYSPKLFNIGQIAIATYGDAFVSGRTIASFVSEFEAGRKGTPSIEIDEVAKAFVAFIGRYYDKQQPPGQSLGFIFAGYDKGGVGKLMTFEFPGSRNVDANYNTNTLRGALWHGQTDVIFRLVKGIDPAIGTLPSFVALSDTQKADLVKDIGGIQYNIPFDYMMLQDGIDFALTLVQTTVNMQRFSYGTIGQLGAIPGVGGTVDVVAVTPGGLTWVRRKTLAVN